MLVRYLSFEFAFVKKNPFDESDQVSTNPPTYIPLTAVVLT